MHAAPPDAASSVSAFTPILGQHHYTIYCNIVISTLFNETGMLACFVPTYFCECEINCDSYRRCALEEASYMPCSRLTLKCMCSTLKRINAGHQLLSFLFENLVNSFHSCNL